MYNDHELQGKADVAVGQLKFAMGRRTDIETPGIYMKAIPSICSPPLPQDVVTMSRRSSETAATRRS